MSFSDVVTFVFLIAFAVYRIERFDGRFPRAAAVTLAFFVAFLLVYLIGWFNLETAQSLAQWAKGMIKFLLHFLFLVAGVALIARRGHALLLADARRVRRRARGERRVRPRSSSRSPRRRARTSTRPGCSRSPAATARSTSSARSRGRSSTASTRSPATRTTSASRSPPGSCSCCRSTCGSSAVTGSACRSRCCCSSSSFVDLATLSRSGLLGLGCGFLVLAIPYRRLLLKPQFLVPLGVLAPRARGLRRAARRSSSRRCSSSRLSTEGRGADTHFIVYSFIPDVLAQNPLFGLGLNTFSVYYEFQTGKTNFGPHSFYVASFVEYGLVGTLALRRVPRLPLPAGGADAADRPRARRRRRPARGARSGRSAGA